MARILQQHPSLGFLPEVRGDLGVNERLCCSGRNLYCPHVFSLTAMLAAARGVIVAEQFLTTCRQCHCRLPVPGPVLRALQAFAGLIFTVAVCGGYDDYSYIATEKAVS